MNPLVLFANFPVGRKASRLVYCKAKILFDLLPRFFSRRHELPDRHKYRLDTLIMILQPHLNLLESLRELFLRGGYFSDLYEGLHDSDVNVNGAIHV